MVYYEITVLLKGKLQSRLETWFSILEVFENQVSRLKFWDSSFSKNFSRISNRDFEETI